MKIVAQIIFIVLTSQLHAQTTLRVPERIETPTELNKIIEDSIVESFAIDFTGDGKKDYIIVINTGQEDEPLKREYWFTSQFELFKTVDLFFMDYDFKFFANIDQDPEPEIIRASGYPDGIDYWITDQNMTLKTEDIMFYFNPLIEKTIKNEKQYFWGHPWKWEQILRKKEHGFFKINCSLHHNIKRDGEIFDPGNQKIFPVIIFSGDPKNNYDYSELLESFEWLTIEAILTRIKK